MHTRPRIGLVVPSLEEGGGVASVADFACDTIERSGMFDLAIISPSVAARDDLGVALTRPTNWFRGVSTSEGTWRGRRFVRIGAWGSELEFRRYQPRRSLTHAVAECDLLQVVSGSPAHAWSVCGLGKPVAVHCATLTSIERRSRNAGARGPVDTWHRWMTRIVSRMDRIALQSVDAIQVMNSWMCDYAHEVNAGRGVIIQFVPPGVDAARFRPAPRRNLRSDPYILCVGRLNDERKNVGLLLRAFAALPTARQRTICLLLAGIGSPSEEFWSHAAQLGLQERVRFISSPTVAQLVGLYQSASVFALPSNEEGFGLVITEAMACGIPVVSTRSGGPDGIIRDGHDGFLVDVNDAAALADRLDQILSDDELNIRMGQAARQTVLEKYDTRVAGRSLLATYDALLGNRRADVVNA
jgi:glycosyltransferase involved in cell wall biosynthesis